jgi:cystathionine beta-lyase
MLLPDPLAQLASTLSKIGRTRVGRDLTVNPPIQRASTLLFDEADGLFSDANRTYGLEGLSVHDCLKGALLAVEGGAGCTLAPSGLAACTLALLAATRSGDEVLITDSVYRPTRRFADGLLSRFGVTARYFDPACGAQIDSLIQPNTRLIWLESPGSITFEVQDIPAITSVARPRGVLTAIDNTWSAGVFFKPFEHGVDLSIQALTKYQAGHADVLMGSVIGASADVAEQVAACNLMLGMGVSPDDAYLVLRGLRTMPVRLAQQGASALKVAHWLSAQAAVSSVLHPALPGAPGHALWARDFTGASGVFGFTLAQAWPDQAVSRFMSDLSLFGIGASWGGFESLIVPGDRMMARSATRWQASGPLFRLSIGLEDPNDLIADLDAGLAQLSLPL